MARITYKNAIQWIVDNDDTEWVKAKEPIPSVTAVLVSEIYRVNIDQVVRAIKKLVVADEPVEETKAEGSVETSTETPAEEPTKGDAKEEGDASTE